MSGAATNLAESPSHWATLMDETVAEIFATMLGYACDRAEESVCQPAPSITASVEFSGTLEGRCVVGVDAQSAAKLAEAFLGGGAEDAMIADAVGELCNMLAGGWKRRLGPPRSAAGLSVPAIARGESPHAQSGALRVYTFGDAQFGAAITADAER